MNESITSPPSVATVLSSTEPKREHREHVVQTQYVSMKGTFKNKFFLLLFIIFFNFLVLPEVLINSFWKDVSSNSVFNPTLVKGLLLMFSLITCVTAWALFLVAICHRRHAPVGGTTSSSDSFKKSFTYKFVYATQGIMIVSATVFFSMLLVFRSGASEVHCATFLGTGDFNCNPYAKVPIFPMDTAFILILMPSCFAIVMKEKRRRLTLCCWALSVLAMIISAIVLRSNAATTIIIAYTIQSAVVMVDSFQLHVLVKKLHESLTKSMQETQALLDQQKLNQMKDVIGNVSHDLKTVSVLMNRL